MAPLSQLSFWRRMGLEDACRDICLKKIGEVYPGREIQEVEEQGYCSFTVLVNQPGGEEKRVDEGVAFVDDVASGQVSEEKAIFEREGPTACDATGKVIVQFRPEQHALDIEMTAAAKEGYGRFVPGVEEIPVDYGVLIPLKTFQIDLVPGMQYSHCQHRAQVMDEKTWTRQLTLIRDFGTFIASAWPTSSASLTPRSCTGKVGARITSKLAQLAEHLPSQALRHRASAVLSNLRSLELLPVVLNHGDLIPTNILLNYETFHVNGMVDWAEAEFLPFGVCLYGLEHMLGFLISTDANAPRFQYYDGAEKLRKAFWDQLLLQCPDIEEWRTQIKVSRDVGVLLWYGFAWDEGKVDRVVNDCDDVEEVVCLKAFLDVE